MLMSCAPGDTEYSAKTVVRIQLLEARNPVGVECTANATGQLYGSCTMTLGPSGTYFGLDAWVHYTDGSRDADFIITAMDETIVRVNDNDTIVGLAPGETQVRVTARKDAGRYLELAITVLPAESTPDPDSNPDPGSEPERPDPDNVLLNSTFITFWHHTVDQLAPPGHSYADSWNEVFDDLATLGMDTVVVQYTHYMDPTNDTNWAEHGSLYQDMFAAAEEADINIWLGLGFDKRWEHSDPVDFLVPAQAQIELIDELRTAGFTASAAFAGWYLPFEADNSTRWSTPAPLISYVNAIMTGDPEGHPMMVAPFFGHHSSAFYSSPADYARFCDNALTELRARGIPLNVIALQHGIGTSRLSYLEHVEPYFKALSETVTRHAGTELWSTLELFTESSEGNVVTTDFERAHCQHQMAERYTSRIIAFEYFGNLSAATGLPGTEPFRTDYARQLSEGDSEIDCDRYKNAPDDASVVIAAVQDPLGITDCTGLGTAQVRCTVNGALYGYFGFTQQVQGTGVTEDVTFESTDPDLGSCDPAGLPNNYCTVVIRATEAASFTVTVRSMSHPYALAALQVHFSPTR